MLSQNNPVHTFAPYSLKIHFNIIVHSRLGFQDCLSVQVSPLKFRMRYHPFRLCCHLTLLYLITLFGVTLQIKKLLIMQYSLSSSSFLSLIFSWAYRAAVALHSKTTGIAVNDALVKPLQTHCSELIHLKLLPSRIIMQINTRQYAF